MKLHYDVNYTKIYKVIPMMYRVILRVYRDVQSYIKIYKVIIV